MRPRPAQWFAAALLLFVGSALADPFGYASGFRDLYRIDLANGQTTLVGRIGFNDVEGFALSPGGVLFGAVDGTMQVGNASSSTSDFLIRISPTSGAGSLVGQLPSLQGRGPSEQLDYGLAFTCDGKLWLASETTAELWEVNPVSAELRFVGGTGANISGMAARGNELFGVSVDPTPRLHRIDTTTGLATAVGPLSVTGPVRNAGLDFDATGNLWATLDPLEIAPSRLARIDVLTGSVMEIRNLTSESGIGIKALAISPPGACPAGPSPAAAPVIVPGPSAPLLVLLAGLAGLMGIRRARLSS